MQKCDNHNIIAVYHILTKAYLVFKCKQEPYGTNTVAICLYAENFKFVCAAEYLQFISLLSKNK